MLLPCGSNNLHIDDVCIDWTGLSLEAERLLGSAAQFAGLRVMFAISDIKTALAAVVYGMIHELDWGVIELSRVNNFLRTSFTEAGVTLINVSNGESVGVPPDLGEVVPGRITVMTSGTTGNSKLIAHSPATLNTFNRARSLPPNLWFVPYQLGTYAWYQMVMLGLFMPMQHLALGDSSDLAHSFEKVLSKHKVTAISSTPTFWRHILMSIDEETITHAPLLSISLGGEVVDQAILDRLSALYPDACIRHIYASSESGSAIVVSDGRAGFDRMILDQPDRTIQIKISQGRLFVRSPFGQLLSEGEWIDTGDLVAIRGERVHFLGRANGEMVNVGGQKAFPADIQALLLGHPSVLWAQVTGRRAPMVGQLPSASVVLSVQMDACTAEVMLIAYCAESLPDYAIPRFWDFPLSVPLGASLKS